MRKEIKEVAVRIATDEGPTPRTALILLYHSTLGLKVINMKKNLGGIATDEGQYRANAAHISQSRPDAGLGFR